MDEERPLRPLWRVGSYTKHAALYHMHGADNGECPRGEGGERKGGGSVRPVRVLEFNQKRSGVGVRFDVTGQRTEPRQGLGRPA